MHFERTYNEYEEILAAFPSWSLSDVKDLPVRERRHWYKWARIRLDKIRNGTNS